MIIVIPTYHRTDRQLTWNTINPELRHLITFVVRPEEADIIRQRYAPSSVMVTPATSHNGTMQWMFEQMSDKKFIYMDDDITRFYKQLRFHAPESDRVKEHPFAAVRCETMEDQLQMFERLLACLDNPLVAAVSPRSAQSGASLTLQESAQWCCQFIAIDGPKASGLRWDRLERYFDLDFTLQLLDRGLDTAQRNDYYYCIAPTVWGGPNKDEYRNLAALWPQVIRPGNPLRTNNMKKNGAPKEFMFMRVKFLKQRRKELEQYSR